MSAVSWAVDKLVTADGILQGARVTAENGSIVALAAAAPAATDQRLRGTLLPGFVDLQVNGAGGRSVDEGTTEALDAVARAVAAGGAVAFLPTLITAPWERLLDQVANVARWIARNANPGAVPLGLHLEGPFLTAPGAHDASCFLAPERARLDELLSAAAGQLRMVTLAHSHALAPAAIEQLVAAGVTCSLGHCSDTAGFRACVQAGARSVTHLFNAMGGMHHRHVGVPGLALDEPRLSCALIVDGVHVHPAIVRSAFAVLGPDRTVLVSDAVAAAGMPDGAYQLSGMAVTSSGGVVRDAAGHLAGSALTMAMAARNFLAFVPNAGPWTLGRVAATNPARLARTDAWGSIAIGKRAAFTLLGEDGSLTALLPPRAPVR